MVLAVFLSVLLLTLKKVLLVCLGKEQKVY